MARLHATIADSRKDFLHKLSTRLINEHHVTTVESLAISDMQRNRCLAKSIGDAGWSEFLRPLAYKARCHGRKLIGIDRWYPGSKRCPEYGTTHDRNLNTARNILAAGLAVSVYGEAVSPLLQSCGMAGFRATDKFSTAMLSIPVL